MRQNLQFPDGKAAIKSINGLFADTTGNITIDMVRIYDATVESSTGVVTITDGTPVSDLKIGDEIRTPDGVYQKTKDSITTGSPIDLFEYASLPVEPENIVQSVNGNKPDASGNVTIETGSSVDESRLLPANAADRDIPIFDATSTVGGGNDETTKFLIQIPAGGSLITDTAAGNAAPVPIENNGVSVNAAGAMVFNGSGYLKIAANTLPADLMGQDVDYTIDILYTATSKDRQCLFGRGDSPRMDFLLDSNGSLQIGGGPSLGSGWPFDTEVLLTFECWKEDTAWRYTCYRDGAVVTSGTWGSSNWRGSDLWIGWEGTTGSRVLTGQIKALRLSNTALHKGTAFSPDYPWSVPEVVGEWGTLNESTLVTQDSNRLLPAPDTVPSDNVGNPVVFKAASRIDNTYLLCFPFNEDARDRSLYNVDISVYGVLGRSDLAPAAPGGSLYMSGRGCVHGTLPVMLGTLDFTVRFWMMAPVLSSSSYPMTLFSTRQGSASSGSTFALQCTAEGRLYVYSNTNITSNTDTPFTLQAGVWYHIAVVRSSGTVTIYVNGQTYTSGTFTNNLTRQIFGIGASWTGSDYQEAGHGYLTSLDVLNYAVYTGPFEVPEYKAGVPSDMKYMVASSDDVKDLLTKVGLDETRMMPVLLTRPTYDDGLHLEMFYASQDDYSDEQQLINTKTVANDRNLVKAFGGTSWIVCPAEGFGSLFNKAPVKVILSSKLDTTKIYNIKYRWVSMTSDTSVSDWYGMVYPCCTEPMI